MAEFAFEPEPAGVALAPGETAREIAGKNPWLLAGRRLRAQPDRAGRAGAVRPDRRWSASAAPIYAHHIAHTDPFASNSTAPPSSTARRSSAPAGRRRARARRDADRADLARELPPRRRQPGPRRRRARPLRRPRVARDRHRLRAHLLLRSRLVARRCSPGFFGGSVDVVLSRVHGPRLGVPGLPARDLARDRAAHAPDGLQLGPVTVDPASLWIPTLIIALVYVPYVSRPVRGQVLSRAREGVRRGGGRAGRLDLAADASSRSSRT